MRNLENSPIGVRVKVNFIDTRNVWLERNRCSASMLQSRIKFPKNFSCNWRAGALTYHPLNKSEAKRLHLFRRCVLLMGFLNIEILENLWRVCCRFFILAKCMCDISQILWEVIAIAAQEPRLNNEIRARECRLIAHDGEQLGIYSVARAQQIADDEGFDLVEIAANANPPVCRIMDYAKFKYDQEIKAKQARKKQTKIETKEMKFRPKIDVGDYDTKKKHVLRFLSAGNKVKITIMFRGREMAHPEQGLSILERLSDDLKDVAVVENQPKMEGRNMHMLIAPVPGAIKKKEATPSKKKGKNRRSKDNKVKEKQEKENEDA